jgi:hypothetical protein
MAILGIGGTGCIGPHVSRRPIARGENLVRMEINPGAASVVGLEGRVAVRGDVTQFDVRQQEGRPPIAAR